MIIDKAGEARRAEDIGILAQRHFLDRAETMAEHDGGKGATAAVGRTEECRERRSVQCLEFHILAQHRVLLIVSVSDCIIGPVVRPS